MIGDKVDPPSAVGGLKGIDKRVGGSKREKENERAKGKSDGASVISLREPYQRV